MLSFSRAERLPLTIKPTSHCTSHCYTETTSEWFLKNNPLVTGYNLLHNYQQLFSHDWLPHYIGYISQSKQYWHKWTLPNSSMFQQSLYIIYIINCCRIIFSSQVQYISLTKIPIWQWVIINIIIIIVITIILSKTKNKQKYLGWV